MEEAISTQRVAALEAEMAVQADMLRELQLELEASRREVRTANECTVRSTLCASAHLSINRSLVFACS